MIWRSRLDRELEAHDGQARPVFSEESNNDTKPGFSQAVAIIMAIDLKKSRKLRKLPSGMGA